MALDPRVSGAPTVLAPPAGARVQRDLVYRTDGDRVLKLDVYRPSSRRGASPVVFLVNGDAPEEIIATAKDWGVFRSYGEHLAARGLAGVPFNHRSSNRLAPTEVAADVEAAIGFVRRRGGDLRIDVDRVGVWVFSAGGPFGLAPFLQRRPEWLRCATMSPFSRGPIRSCGKLESEASISGCSIIRPGSTASIPATMTSGRERSSARHSNSSCATLGCNSMMLAEW